MILPYPKCRKKPHTKGKTFAQVTSAAVIVHFRWLHSILSLLPSFQDMKLSLSRDVARFFKKGVIPEQNLDADCGRRKNLT